jgi:tetratricopeptide (TPR) repeat protein
VDTATDELAHRAADAFASGDFRETYRLAQGGLRDLPDDSGFLALAGRAAAELGLEDAVTYLGRLVERAPDDADAWRDLGQALLAAADFRGAERALRAAVRLDPDDPATRISLSHVAYQDGAVEEAARMLWETAKRVPGDSRALRSLIEMRRLQGRTAAALDAAAELARRMPSDLQAIINIAELHMLAGNGDEALQAHRRLRELDPEPGHAGYIIHGMAEVEIRRERWRPALDLAIAATKLDRHQLTTDLLALVSARLFGEGSWPVKDRADVLARLERRRAEHRRLHADELVDGRAGQ